MVRGRWIGVGLVLLAAGCAGDGGAAEGGGDGTVDAAGEVAADDADDARDGAGEPDGDADAVGPMPLEVPTFRAYVTPPAGSVLPAGLESCGVIRDEACVGGTRRACALYDGPGGDWAADVPPMTEQAFVFDRFFDRYHAPEGQSMDVRFTGAVPAGTPESEWARPEVFERYDGYGDTSGWTGTALWGAAARYHVTGTDADYARMLARLEAMAFLYEVTDVPGLLARSHFAMLPEGAPHPLGLWGKAVAEHRVGDGTDGHFVFPIAERFHERLPAYYLTEVVIDGQAYPTTPAVMSDASRDMYVRSMPGVLLAWDLLGAGARADAVRAVLREELPCTLNRMKKGRIRNLQQSGELQEAVTAFFAGEGLQLDPEDVDFEALDTLIFYVLEQPSPLHPEAFDRACPDGPPMDVDPELDLDATAPLFLLELAQLAQREQRQGEVPVTFSMHVSVRATDALFMTQWALTAHMLTGDARYPAFLAGLMEEIDYVGVLNTYGAFQLPRWCAPHFAPSLGYPSLYNVLARVDPGEAPAFWKALATVARVEGHEKENGPREDAFWELLYGRMMDAQVDPQRDAVVAAGAARLATYGMHAADKLEPDRAYPRNWVDTPDPAIPLEELVPEDPRWALCEEPTTVLGIEVPPPRIDGIPWRSVDPLPLGKRIGGTFLWQMDPWMVKREYGGVGMDRQWPMLGLFTPYWVGRSDGAITEGQGLALAWRDTGEACGP